MTPQEAAELLDRVIERAAKLRAAGVRKVNLGVASFEFVADADDGDVGGTNDDGSGEERSLVEMIAGDDASKKERPPL